MKKIILLCLISILFYGCATGVDVSRDLTTGFQTTNEWDRTAFGTNSDRREYWRCDPEPNVSDEYRYPSKQFGKNCKKEDTRYNVTSGNVNQLIMPAAVVTGSALIGDGIRDSGNTNNINVDNSNRNANRGPGRGWSHGRGRD